MRAVFFVLLCAALTGAASCLMWRFHFYVADTLSWTDAQAHCRNISDDLATMTSDWENNETAVCTDGCWIGLSNRTNQSDFSHWSDGDYVAFEKWSPGEPSRTEDVCVASEQRFWYAYDCQSLLSFFCFKWIPNVVLVNEEKTWEEARAHCRQYYSDMISMPWGTELVVTNKKIPYNETSRSWIGLRFLNGNWFWTNGEFLGFLISMPSCPPRPYYCMAKIGANVFENRDCNEKMSFICYY